MYTDKSVRFTGVQVLDDAFFVPPAKNIVRDYTYADIFSRRPLPEKADAPDFQIAISKNEQRRVVSTILYNLNLSSADSAFYFMREIIVEMANSCLFIPELNKEALKKIGKAFKVTSRTVENALNKAIDEINQKNSRQEIIMMIMGQELSVDSSFVNTKEFILMVADYIRLTYSNDW